MKKVNNDLRNSIHHKKRVFDSGELLVHLRYRRWSLGTGQTLRITLVQAIDFQTIISA